MSSLDLPPFVVSPVQRLMCACVHQFLKYYETDETKICALKIEDCLEIDSRSKNARSDDNLGNDDLAVGGGGGGGKGKGSMIIAEPLHHLVRCIQKCIVFQLKQQQQQQQQDNADTRSSQSASDASSSPTLLRTHLNSLLKRMVDAELEAFELDSTTDFSSPRTTEIATLVLGIYETLLDFTVVSAAVAVDSSDGHAENPSFDSEPVQNVLKLFQATEKIRAMFQQQSSGRSVHLNELELLQLLLM